jgi:hypothetical protein
VSSLPRIDEHSTEVAAPPDATWQALVSGVPGAFAGSARVARLLGCEQTEASGRQGEEGSTIPGFRVVRTTPPRELALDGRHRFSRYALIFRIDDLGNGASRLRAETRAEFPGARGSVYRALVIGTRGHVLVTKRMLNSVGRRAEREKIKR